MYTNSKCPLGLNDAESKNFQKRFNCSAISNNKEDAPSCFAGHRPSFACIGRESMCEKMREHTQPSGCVPPCKR